MFGVIISTFRKLFIFLNVYYKKHFIMQKIILYTVTLLLTTLLYAQNKTGIVKDSATDNPIAYATLQITKNHGTITNEEGKFSLNVSNFKKTDSLKVSYLGYKTVSFAIKDIPETILLEEDVVNLDEVNLNQEQLSVEEIIQRARENQSKNYNNLSNLKQLVFLRFKSIAKIKEFKMEIDKAKNYDKKMIKKLNKVIDSIRDLTKNKSNISYKDLLFNLYRNDKDSTKLSYVKATLLSNPNNDFSAEAIGDKLKRGFKNLFKDKVFKIKILFFKVEDSLKTKDIVKKEKMLIHPANLARQMGNLYKHTTYSEDNLISEILNEKYYDYKITNNLFYNNEFVYEITYSPKRSKAKYKGKIYISDESFAVIKLDFNMLPNKKVYGKSLKWLGFAYKLYDWKGTLEFYQDDSGKYVPKYIKQSKKSYSYSNIPLKFIENTKNKNKLKFKLKSEFENIETQKTEMIFLQNNGISNKEYKAIKMKKDFPIIKLKKYDSSIWKAYNIVAPTQDLLDYIVE